VIAAKCRASGKDVVPQLLEALFGSKAALLKAAVDYAIRGDVEPVPMPQRRTVLEMEAAHDAPEMLRLHARHVRLINPRSARIALVVEQAAAADRAVAELWTQMNHNRQYAVRWATETLFRKRGHRRGLTRRQAESVFWVGLDWATYRTLTEHAALTNERVRTLALALLRSDRVRRRPDRAGLPAGAIAMTTSLCQHH
jgi:AcrR family transcriptional regulator